MKQVNNYPNYFVDELGNVYSTARGKILKLKPEISKIGYLRVQLYKNGAKKRVSVHRLIAKTFIDVISMRFIVWVWYGDKADNRVINLEWCTRSENMRHAIKSGLRPVGSNRGEKHGNSKLTTDDVLEIRALKGKISGRMIAEKYKISLNTVALIWAKKVWSWL